jgi:hypothetical protein
MYKKLKNLIYYIGKAFEVVIKQLSDDILKATLN